MWALELSRDNPERYTVSRPNIGANTSVLAQITDHLRICPQRLFLEDPKYNHLPCGALFFGGYWRAGCTLSCCVVPIKDETDSEWDPDATDVETDADTDDSASAAA